MIVWPVIDRLAGAHSHSTAAATSSGSISRPCGLCRTSSSTVCSVERPVKPPLNPLEIREVRLFDEADIPAKLAFGFEDLLAASRSPGTVLE